MKGVIEMKKLTKKQKAAYPEFIAVIDLCADHKDEFKGSKGYTEPGYYVKAMEEKDIFAAMRRIENVIRKQGYAVYLADILGKSGEEYDDGAPVYEIKMRTRVHLSEWEKDDDGNRKALPTKWHFCDKEHYESNECIFKWYASADRYGWLEWLDRKYMN